jgi:hypothetical protein
MYFEASSFGLGLNDSRSLAPPLRIHAVASPLEQLLHDPSVITSMIHLPNVNIIASSSAAVSTTPPDFPCKCDHLSHGVHYLLGVVNNPYYGHVLTNTLSNLFATLYMKRLEPKVSEEVNY